jgi:limonene-1,2-epoxide hydrolase
MDTHPDSAMTQPADSSPRAVVERFLAALERLDSASALALLADDAVYQNVPLPAARGAREIARTLAAMQKFVKRFEVRMHNIAVNGDVVLTERTDILQGPWIDLTFWVCGTFEVRQGKIVLWRDYFDTPTFLWQLLTSPLRTLRG